MQNASGLCMAGPPLPNAVPWHTIAAISDQGQNMHIATKIVIITERTILDAVADLLEAHGATGYTFVAAGGKGSRGKRRIDRAPQITGILENVKIEAIVPDHETAERITEAVVEAYFDNYSGITYLEPVEILRPGKFRI